MHNINNIITAITEMIYHLQNYRAVKRDTKWVILVKAVLGGMVWIIVICITTLCSFMLGFYDWRIYSIS